MNVLIIMMFSLMLSGCYMYSGGYYGGYNKPSTGYGYRSAEYQQRYENAQRNQILQNQRRQEQLMKYQNRTWGK